MGSRPVVQQQNRGEAVAVVVKPPRNRRALGDIGNVVNVAPAENNKKPTHKKVSKKPKPVSVIEISPDTEKEPNEQIQVKPAVDVIIISPDTNEDTNKKKFSKEGLSRKKRQSLTSTLTARSKFACGLDTKPNELIVDIDASDVDNELAVVEYVEDIYNFYKIAENESQVFDYMDTQPELNEKMRAILIDWITEVHNKFDLMQETLYLTINIVDRYLARKSAEMKELQLIGIGAMLIASKYEEIWAPEVNDFVCISDKAYSHQQVLVMEKCILTELEWNLTVPTPYVFLVRFIKASLPFDHDMENLVYFLAELGMMNYVTVMYCPSMVAASAVYAARCTLNKNPIWTDTLKLHTGFSESQLLDCAKLLVSFHVIAPGNKLKVIYRKYSNPQRGIVALIPPAKILLASA